MTAEPTIRSIETTYNGYRFRSRTEAKWAVFFDALGIAYEFEPEGYEITQAGERFGEVVTTRYLPDFWLPGHGCFVEIKGIIPNADELAKARALRDATSSAVYIFFGEIGPPAAWDDPPGTIGAPGAVVFYAKGGDFDGYVWMEEQRDFTDLAYRRERKYSIENPYNEPRRLPGVGQARRDLARTPELLDAYAKARSYRFKGLW